MRKMMILALGFALSAPLFSQNATVTVVVTGVKNNNGKVEIGLYNDKDSFPVYTEVFKGATLTSVKEGVTYSFKEVPAGTYAIAVWQDENMDKKLNRNLFGSPTENYGFSLNKYGVFAPPHFEDVSFKVEAGKNITQNIKME
jgi:uncharacterized protein (DUF2141 family)